ncbi:MAG: hypothetical protein GWO21_15340, partial [Gammaproteobacteria bacterium]|nr:hypothetical protein [Gammaproteobacteria bacterium]
MEETQDGYRAWILVAMGQTYTESAETLEAVRGVSLQSLGAMAANSYGTVPATILNDLPAAVHVHISSAWFTLVTCRDKESGRVVRSPAVTPPMARDWPRYGAWIALARAASGDDIGARRSLARYLEGVRMDDRP